MKKLLIILMMMFSFGSFGQSKKSKNKAFDVFNEGVAFSLDAIKFVEKEDYQKASELNNKAIEKFKQTINIDPNHSLAYSALGHTLYLERNYREAINYFDKAIEMQPELSVNYQERGLCKINLGNIEEGIKDINQAFTIDNSEELKDNTILSLQEIGLLAYDYGEGYIKQGEKEKGENYKGFSIAVLLTAYDLDKTRKRSAKLVADYAAKIGDQALKEQFEKLSQ